MMHRDASQAGCRIPDSGAENGFTLMEAVVALGLLGLLFTAILPAFMVCMNTNTRDESRSEASALAQQTMESLRRQDLTSLPASGASGPDSAVVGTRSYDVLTRYCVDNSLCPPNTRQVVVEVSLGGRLVFSLESVFTEFN